MAKNKTTRKTKAAAAPARAGSIWLAGIGAFSLARKRGQHVLADMVEEGQRLRGDAVRRVRARSSDVKASLRGMLTPVQARLDRRARHAAAALRSGFAGALARMGIPSQAEVDQLAQRVSTLSRQRRTAR